MALACEHVDVFAMARSDNGLKSQGFKIRRRKMGRRRCAAKTA